ncbi:MAG: AraC family transcriptional regulator [Verrucomicrobiota bacterium]
MQPPSSLLEELESLPRRAPPDYFHGVRAAELCRADNLLVFLRRERSVLFETGFATRPHHRYVLVINFATAGTLHVDGVGYRLHPGEAFLLVPYQLHFYLDVAAEQIRWLYFTFEAREAGAFEAFRNLPLALDAAELAEALRLARAHGRVELDGPGGREALILGFALFLTRLKQQGLRRGPPLVAPSIGDALLERINRLLAWHLADGLDIGALAGRLALSESHLRKRFREATGMSLGHYLLHYRLNRAIKLLVHSDASLTQIAAECGYESLAAFSRAFKAKLGETPSSFRRSGGADTGRTNGADGR